MQLPDKPYVLSFDEKPKYLHAKVTCEAITLRIAVSYLRDILDECLELQYARVLIERDIPDTLPPQISHRIASKFVRIGVDNFRVAFVDRKMDNPEFSKGVAAISSNLGVDVRLYSSRHDARRWLTAPESA